MTTPILISTFLTVFLAELGDKTQLATLSLSGTTNRPLAVFVGASLALVVASFIGAIAGGSISSLVPETTIQLIAAIGFLVIGIRLLVMNRIRADDLLKQNDKI